LAQVRPKEIEAASALPAESLFVPFQAAKSNLDHKRTEVLPLKFDGLLADITGNEAKSGI
jgi:hypothetical protein